MTMWYKNALVKVSLFSALSTIIKMLSSLVVSKVVAVYVGPAGLGTMGQLTNFIAILVPLSTGGVLLGITKYIAEFNSNEKNLDAKRVLSTSLWIVIFCTLIISLFIFFFSERMTMWLFGSILYKEIVRLLGLLLLTSSLSSWILAVLNGNKMFKVFNVISIISSIVGLLVTILFSIYLGVYGALISLILTQVVTFIIALCFFIKSKLVKVDLITSFDIKSLQGLSKFSLMAIVSAFTVPYTQLLIRYDITKNLGAKDAGLWEGMNRISSMHLLFITTSLVTYYLPRLSEIKNNIVLRNEVYQVSKIIIPIVFVTSITIFSLKGMVIRTLFTSEFMDIDSLFFSQLTGDFFKIISWLFATLMLAKVKQVAYISSEILFAIFYYALATTLMKIYGIQGVTYSYLLTYLVYMIFTFSFFLKLTSKTNTINENFINR